jgi:hypothetical protein
LADSVTRAANDPSEHQGKRQQVIKKATVPQPRTRAGQQDVLGRRQTRRRTLSTLSALVTLSFVGAIMTATPASAADCEYRQCGEIYNRSGWALVAASLDKSGGDCPPFGECGTCAVPPNTNSKRSACARVFRDTDVFTFDNTPFAFDGNHYAAHRYVKFRSDQKVDCSNNSVLRKPVCWSEWDPGLEG